MGGGGGGRVSSNKFKSVINFRGSVNTKRARIIIIFTCVLVIQGDEKAFRVV